MEAGDYAVSETNDLVNLANKITILTNGEKAPEIRADNVEVITKGIKEVSGSNRAESIIFKDDSVLKTDGIFIAQGSNGPVAIAKKLGILLEDNKIVINENMQTNIDGIFACGDCTSGLMQVSKAVYDGARAGLEVIKYVKVF